MILCVLFLCACAREKRPEGVFDQDKMTEVLMEIHLLEAKIQKLYLPGDSGDVIYRHYEKMLFEDLGITEEEYDQSLIYYVENSKELGEVYDRIVDSLMLKQNITK